MAKVKHQQNDFTAGELSPLLYMRSDLDHYHRGAKRLENVICLPQGGVTRRDGLKFVDTIAGPGAVVPAQLFGFLFGDDQGYLIVFLQGKILVYKDDILFQTITMTSDTVPVAVPWQNTDLDDLRARQSADTMIIVHEDYPPHRLVRNTSSPPEVFELYDLSKVTTDQPTLQNIPRFNYNDASSPVPADVDEVQRISFLSGWSEGDRYRLKFNNKNTPWVPFKDDREVHANQLQVILRNLSTTSLQGISVEVDPAASPTEDFFLVTFGGLDGGKDQNLIVMELGSSALGTFSVVETVAGASRAEDVWSIARGWPRSVSFHAGRLWFGGSKSRPSTIWASKTGAEFFNFDLGDSLDSDAIAATIDSDEINVVQHLISSRTLVIFTKSAEYTVATDDTTPKDIKFQLQTSHGANGVGPVNIDGATLWVDHVQRAIREFLFEFSEDSYRGGELSILAEHLINKPVDMALHRVGDGDYVYIINTDGSVAVLNVNRIQGIKGFSRLTTTGGLPYRTAQVDDEIYFAVLRTIGGVISVSLEKLDPLSHTDASEFQTGSGSQTTWTGLTRFAGSFVDLLGDGVFLGTQEVTAGGEVTTEADDIVTLEIGLPFDLEVTPLPFAPQSDQAATLLAYKAIPKITVMVQNSLNVIVNGDPIPPRAFPAPTGAGPPLIDGPFDVHSLGWDRLPEVKITQEDPGAFLVLGVAADVEISV